jgi:LytR cell envelope-related transcriptional attenuator
VELIKEIGAFAGLGAFLGLALLSLLYFSQARDVRRLRDWAGRAPERDAEGIEATSGLAAERAEELRRVEEERQRREQALTAEREIAEHRERRRRRREAGLPEQTRAERLRQRFTGGPGSERAPRSRYVIAAVIAVIVLGAAAAVAATQLSGEDEKGGTPQALRPGQVEVAVLNGTNPPVQGLAGTFGDRLEANGFEIGVVTNSRDAFTASVVMFTRGHRPEAARVARRVGIPKVSLITPAIRADSAGATVAVIVGQDKASVTG